MNHTEHFWKRRGPFSPDKFAAAVRDFVRVYEDSFQDILAGWEGSGNPVLLDKQISFNGVDPQTGDTFSITVKGEAGQFSCKTQGFPYDEAVRCCLIILRHHLPEEIEIGSTDRGKMKWRKAQNLVNEVLELEDEFVLDTVD